MAPRFDGVPPSTNNLRQQSVKSRLSRSVPVVCPTQMLQGSLLLNIFLLLPVLCTSQVEGGNTYSSDQRGHSYEGSQQGTLVDRDHNAANGPTRTHIQTELSRMSPSSAAASHSDCVRASWW